MKQKSTVYIVLLVMSALILTACRPDSNGVATLKTAENTQNEVPVADTTDPILDNEAMMIAFTECMREQGIEVMDPVVDTDGNVDKPELVEGAQWDKDDESAWNACADHLEGFIWEKERVDMSEQVDQYIALAVCLREKNYDLVDPTAETLNVWMADFKGAIDWDDPDAVADYEECSGESLGGGGKK